MAVIGQALVEILPFTGGFATALDKEVTDAVEKASTANSGMFDKLANLGKVALTGLAVGFVAVGASAVKLAEDGEASHARLSAALQASGSSFSQFNSVISKQEDIFQTLGYDHAQYQDALARLTIATHNPTVAIQDMGLAANIAAARHMDLTTAAQLVGKVVDGNVGILQRFGLSTKDAAGNTLTAAQAVDMLNKTFGGQAQAQADTFAGKVKALETQFKNVGEEVGTHLIPLLEGLGSAISATITWFEHHTAVALALASAIGGILTIAIGAYIAKLALAVAAQITAFAQMVASAAGWVLSNVLGWETVGDAMIAWGAKRTAAAATDEAAAATQTEVMTGLTEAILENTAVQIAALEAEGVAYESLAEKAAASAVTQEAAAATAGEATVGLGGALGGLGAALGPVAIGIAAITAGMLAEHAAAQSGIPVLSSYAKVQEDINVKILGLSPAGAFLSNFFSTTSNLSKQAKADVAAFATAFVQQISTLPEQAQIAALNSEINTINQSLKDGKPIILDAGQAHLTHAELVASDQSAVMALQGQIGSLQTAQDAGKAATEASRSATIAAMEATQGLGGATDGTTGALDDQTGATDALGNAVSNTANKVLTFTDYQNALKAALDNSDSGLGNVITAQDDASNSLSKLADALNVTIDAQGRATAGSQKAADAQNQVTQSADGLASAQDSLRRVQQQIADQHTALAQAANKVTAAQNALTAAQNAAKNSVLAVQQAQQGVVTAHDNVAKAQDAASASQDQVKAATDTLTQAQHAYTDVQNKVTAGVLTGQAAYDALNQAQDKVNKAQDNLTKAQTAAQTAADAVTTANLNLQKAQEAVTTAQQQQQAATDKVTQAQDNLAQAQENLTSTQRQGADQADQLSAAQHQVQRASQDLQKAQENLRDATNQSGDALDLQTQKGKDNWAQMEQVRQKILAVGEQTYAMTHNIDDANTSMDTQVTDLDNVLRAAGYTEPQIKAYNDQLGLTPTQLHTDLSASVNLDISQAVVAAQQAIQAMNSDIPAWALPGNTGASATGKMAGGIVRGAAAGMMTSGPVIAGEGNRLYPEYIIPTDPKYRSNAYELMGSLAAHISAGAGAVPPDAAATTRKLALGLPGLQAGGITSGFLTYGNTPPQTIGSITFPGDPFMAAAYDAYLSEVNQTAGGWGLTAVSAGQAAANAYPPIIAGAYNTVTANIQGLIGDAIAKAATWIGVPYLWGGGHGVSEAVARRLGVDCSGLVDQVFGIQGTTFTQINMGTPVPNLAAAMSGDLVFFGTVGGGGDPHHVGIYGGQGQMIDAPKTGTFVRWDNVSGFGPIYGIRRLSMGALGGPATPPTVQGNIVLGQRMAGQRGWTGNEWGALYQVGQMESGWNQFARNASSGAYGIPQALPESKLPFAGQASGGSDPAAQIGWMIGYIAGRYGDPLGALAHEHNFHWYDQGGWLQPGLTLAMNTSGRSERVVSGGGPESPTFGPGSVVVNIDANFSGQPDPGTVKQLQTMVQRGVTDAMVAVLDRVSARRPGG